MSRTSLFDVSSRVACVTGASSGLGRAAATVLAQAGARVVGVARRADELEAWHKETDGHTACVVADLSAHHKLKDTASAVCSHFGAPDILINATGINTREHADHVTAENWELTLRLNLGTPFFLAQLLVPAMKKRSWGRIINFASLQSQRAFASGITYGVSKGGIVQLTRAMAESWSKYGIMVNAVAPGFFRTALTVPVFSDPVLAAQHAAQTCIGRNGEPEDLNGPILFFSSGACSYVTGQVLFVDGGYTAK